MTAISQRVFPNDSTIVNMGAKIAITKSSQKPAPAASPIKFMVNVVFFLCMMISLANKPATTKPKSPM